MTKQATIELTRVIDAPRAVLFKAIKEGQLLRSTNVVPETFKNDFRVGGAYFLEWRSVEGAKCEGKYTEIVEDSIVQFTWKSRGCPSAPSRETLVTVTLKDVGEKCEMKLVHEGLDSGFCHDDHLVGWTSTFDDMQPIVEATSGKQAAAKSS